MKKILALALAVALCVSLAACGGKEPASTPAPAESTPSAAPADSSPEPAAGPEDTAEPEADGGPTDEQLQAMQDAYDQVVDVYNDAVDNAEANGWLADDNTAAEIKTIGDTMEPIGQALSGDTAALEGMDYDALPGTLLDEVLPMVQAVADKVSVPYEEGAEAEAASGEAVVTDEALKPLAEKYNELAPVYNEIYDTAEANGWLDDPQTAAELQALTATLGAIGAGLTDDPSILEGADIDGMVGQLEQFSAVFDELTERVSVPYEG